MHIFSHRFAFPVHRQRASSEWRQKKKKKKAGSGFGNEDEKNEQRGVGRAEL